MNDKKFISFWMEKSKEEIIEAYIECIHNGEVLLNRIEKAINKIQYIKDLGFDYDGFNDVKDLKKLIDELVRIAEQSIDILKGEDERSVK